MKRNIVVAAAAAVAGMAVGGATPAQAAVVYENNFDNENGGNTAIDYNGFTGLTVSGGTVSIIKSGHLGLSCVGGSGACVNLGGSNRSQPNVLSSGSYSFVSGQTTTLAFSLSGNYRQAQNDLKAALNFGGTLTGSWGYSINGTTTDMGRFQGTSVFYQNDRILSVDPFANYTVFFTPDSGGTVSFAFGANYNFSSNVNDVAGPILDNVSLSMASAPVGGAVPEPATWGMMILGFGVVGGAMRRRRPAPSRALA